MGVIAAIVTLALAPSSALAANGSWTQSTFGTNWTTSGNWSGSIVAGTTTAGNNTDIALFDTANYTPASNLAIYTPGPSFYLGGVEWRDDAGKGGGLTSSNYFMNNGPTTLYFSPGQNILVDSGYAGSQLRLGTTNLVLKDFTNPTTPATYTFTNNATTAQTIYVANVTYGDTAGGTLLLNGSNTAGSTLMLGNRMVDGSTTNASNPLLPVLATAPGNVVKDGTGKWIIQDISLVNTAGTIETKGGVLTLSGNRSGYLMPRGPVNNTFGHGVIFQLDPTGLLDTSGGTGATTATTYNTYGTLFGPTTLVLGGDSGSIGSKLTGTGTVVNGATWNGSAWTPTNYASVIVDANRGGGGDGSHISPGIAGAGSAAVGTITTGNQGWWGAYNWNDDTKGSYRFDVASVNNASTTQAAGVGSDLVDVRGQLAINSTSAARFYVTLDGGITSTPTGWQAANNYRWTIATTTGGFVGTGVNSLYLLTTKFTAATQTGNASQLKALGFALTADTNNIYLNYTGSPTSTTYSLTAATDKARLLVGQTANLTVTLTNTGTRDQFNDSVNWTALGVAAPSSGTLTGLGGWGTSGYGPGSSGNTTGTFTGVGTGLIAITPTVGTVTNQWTSTPATAGTVTGTTINVLAKRTFTPTTAVVANVLRNGSTGINASVGYTTSGSHANTTDVTVSNSAFGADANGLSLGAGSNLFNSADGSVTSGSRTLSGTFTNSASYGTVSGAGFALNAVTAEAAGVGLTGEGTYSSVNVNYQVNVGLATTVGLKALGGTVLSGQVAANQALANLASKTLQNVPNGVVGSEATLTGGSLAAGGSVSMDWRTRTDAELTQAGGGLVSDVVNLAGLAAGDLAAVQVQYNTDELAGIWNQQTLDTTGVIRLASWNGAKWVDAGSTWKGSMAAPTGADLSADAGWYGIDTASGTVWAVVAQNGQLAAVPEPGTIGLLLSGVLALAGFAYRRRK